MLIRKLHSIVFYISLPVLIAFYLSAPQSGFAQHPQSAKATAAKIHPMSLSDMMKVEELGAAESDPSGRWLIYERVRPYDQFDDYSFRTYATGKTGHQLWRYDLGAGIPPERLPGLDSGPHSYLQGFSPYGHFLAVMQYRFGALSLGAYDMAKKRIVRFKETPAFSRDGAHNPVWISGDELMFAALPDGEQPDATSVRAHTGQTLTKAWDEAWHGTVVTASEVRSIAKDQSDRQEAGRLVRANAQTGKTEIVAEGLYADLRVSPDRQHLVALSMSKPRPTDPTKLVEDDPRRYQLTVFDLKTNEKRSLAGGLEFFPYTLAWAPDSERVAAYGWRAGEGPRSGRFYVIDVKTGATTRYEHTGLDLSAERERGWLERPERTVFLGDSLAVFARAIPQDENRSPRFTYRDFMAKGLPRADWYALAPDGTSRNLTQDLSGVSGVPVDARTGHLAVVADDGVYRLSADGTRHRLTPQLSGRFSFLSPGTFATRSSVIRPEFSDEALFEVSGNGPAKIVMVDLREGNEGQTLVVDAPSAEATPLAGSLAAKAVLFRAEDGPVSRLEVAKADAKVALTEIARLNTHLADVDLGTWKVSSYEVKDPEEKRPAQTIESCVLLPPGFTPAAPPPLIVEVYPDVGPSCKNGKAKIEYPDPESPYLWAGRGFAYARLTTPRALIRTADGPIAGMPYVVEAGVNALVAQGFVDPKRVALYGYSQGGISSLYVAAHSKLFKAVIAMNSWADLFSDYFGPNGIYSTVYSEYFGDFARYDSVAGSDFGIGKTPFEDPAFYYRNSPVFLAPRIDAPVLLIHSDMDGFSMYQFDEMYGALLRSGKDARYVRYWGEGHGPSSPANIRDMWERIDAFLGENGVVARKP